jgi:hypothetical protein
VVAGGFIVGAVLTPDMSRFSRSAADVVKQTAVGVTIGEYVTCLAGVLLARAAQTSDIVSIVVGTSGIAGAIVYSQIAGEAQRQTTARIPAPPSRKRPDLTYPSKLASAAVTICRRRAAVTNGGHPLHKQVARVRANARVKAGTLEAAGALI